jgi:transcriptional regulator with XRE-family HTH domain
MAVPIEPFYSALGLRILEMRRMRGLTQDKLAAALSPPATRASIANIESGKQRVLAHTLLQLSQALQVTVSELLNVQAEPAKVEGAVVVKELRTKLALPPKQLQRLGRELGLTARKHES